MEEVGQGGDTGGGDDRGDGGNAVMFTNGAGAIPGAWIIPSVAGAGEEVLDNLGGGDEVDLVDVVKLGPGGDREGGGGDDRGGERR